MQNAPSKNAKSNPVALSTGTIVIGAIVILVVMAFVFKGKVNF
jgi:hypothetical protein